MIFHIYSAIGRTGSWRLCKLLSTSYKNYPPFANSFTDPAEEHFCHHVHSLDILPVPEAIPILSTRKNRKDAALSNIIAWKVKEWIPQTQEKNLNPFSVDVNEYNNLIESMIEGERQFIEMYSPVIIYLEDSVEDIERKLSIQVPYPHKDKEYISKYPPKEYIINYSELPSQMPIQVPQNIPGEMPKSF